MGIKYADYIDTKSIEANEEVGENYNYRYSLSIGYKHKTNSEKILIIMRNPSDASVIQADHTVNNVLHYCKDNSGRVYIANLYPHRDSNPESINKFVKCKEYKGKMEINIQIINSIINEVDDVIVAWGSNDKLNLQVKKDEEKIIKEVLEQINQSGKKAHAIRFIESDNPWHPLNWKKSFRLETYEWNKA